jgi:hypothetical protein
VLHFGVKLCPDRKRKSSIRIAVDALDDLPAIEELAVFPLLARAVERHRAGLAANKLIVADLLTELAGLVRGKPSKMNGHTPPPTSMERWAVINKDTGQIIRVFDREWSAIVYRTAERDRQPNLKVKKLNP